MCSYQRINGTYGCDNSKLLNGVLKTELMFEGFVLGDWNAVHRLDSANAGLDIVMPLGGSFGQNLTDAVNNGTVTEERLTDMAMRIIAAWYLAGQDGNNFPPPGIGMNNLTEPHNPVDARVAESKPVILDGAIAGHVLVKNVNHALPFTEAPKMLSVYGYDATIPATKNTDVLFELGYTSSPEMAQAVLGDHEEFDQAARGGTIVVGGRAGANAPAYIIDVSMIFLKLPRPRKFSQNTILRPPSPTSKVTGISQPLNAIQNRAAQDSTWVNWDLVSSDPSVNGASTACLVFINAIATEGWDRVGLHDDYSDALVLNVARQCENTIVIIHAAGVRLVDQWIDHPNVTAVVLAHLPGQDAGTALVQLLYGDAEFSGKLPYTTPKNESDYGEVYAPCQRTSEDDTNPQCDFTEGVYLDYRDFDARNITPRYEFGFGLSYTTFSYSYLTLSIQHALRPGLPQDPESLWDVVAVATSTIANTGARQGQEIAQLYLQIPNSPPRQLRGFQKTHLLGPGEEVTVEFELAWRDFAVWDVVKQQWVVQGGEYAVFVGASSRDIRLTERFNLP